VSYVRIDVSTDEATAELEAVLLSPGFARSPRLASLLRYLCTKYLSGEADQIKEYNIGVEVLGRPPGFDPSNDAGARVEVHRLRRRLQEYYEHEGAFRKLRIVIPIGHYIPAFVPNPAVQPATAAVEPEPELLPVPAPIEPEEVIARPSNGNSAAAVTATPETNRFRPKYLGAVGLLAALVLAGGVWELLRASRKAETAHPAAVQHDSAVVGSIAPVTHRPAVLPQGGVVRFACGRKSAYTDRSGQTWSADNYFEGGAAVETPAPFLARAFDPKLFQNARQGDFTYRIPLTKGIYELRLHFVETVYGPATVAGGGEYSRTFDVVANGRPILTRFDIYSDANGTNVADTRVFKDISPGSDGFLNLEFHSQRAPALVNGIELIPAEEHLLNPLRIVAQENFLTDKEGTVWIPDNYVTGGLLSGHAGQVTGVRDPEVYERERFGHFEYALPVDTGKYALSLHFAEKYWGAGNQGGGGEGNRLFDVFCNGVVLLRNFDILKEAGPLRGLVKTFHGLTPNAQGKLVVTFVPVRDYASIYALEVVDETR
jgi:hypothetical protein